jgi:thiol-disulfide isomerase/thioredoxin
MNSVEVEAAATRGAAATTKAIAKVIANAIIGLALFGVCARMTPALAEVSGQQRAQEAGRALIGSPTPPLVLKTIDGETIDLGSLYGKKAVYLKFWATWCVPCRQQMPHFQHAYETAGEDLAVIAIDVGFNDSIDAVETYRKRLGITMPIVFDDGSLGAAFGLRVTPTHVVIGRDGRIQYIGHLADGELDAALTAARAPAAAGVLAVTGAAAPDPAPIAVGDLLPKKSARTIDGQRFEFRTSALESGAAQSGAAHSGAPQSSAAKSDGTQQKLTVLVFLSPWCESYLATTRPEASASCRGAREQFSALADDAHLRWLGIASGLWANADDLRKYRAQYQVTIPLTLDASGEEFRAFRVNAVPTFLIADAHGRIVRRLEGKATQDTAALRMALSSAGGAR